jgi:hypothetical protein
MSLVRKQWVKWSLILCGTVVLLLLLAFLLFAYYFAGQNKTRLIRESASPDGHFVAEVREVITPMHGGPDLVQVVLKSASQSEGDVVYSQVFECGPDYSAFQVAWQSPDSLAVSYGACDAGNFQSPTGNKKSMAWHEVKISYRDTGHMARSKP